MSQNLLLLSGLHGGLFLAKKTKKACVNLLVGCLEEGCGERNLESSNSFTFKGDNEDPDDKLLHPSKLSHWSSRAHGWS